LENLFLGSADRQKLLGRDEAAAFLTGLGYKTSRAKLAKDAVKGGGCPYVIFNGRALYNPDDLLNWAAARAGAKVRNTAERRERNGVGSASSGAASRLLGGSGHTKLTLQHRCKIDGAPPKTAQPDLTVGEPQVRAVDRP
jgi:hypothetical protein